MSRSILLADKDRFAIAQASRTAFALGTEAIQPDRLQTHFKAKLFIKVDQLRELGVIHVASPLPARFEKLGING
ncbi:MAG: hypothetical protein K8H87_16550 [Pseudorhodoplanes sp.]|nr:hypothetical protein [Pseudorhodoplanes sp.]